jgi:hypothetical protein
MMKSHHCARTRAETSLSPEGSTAAPRPGFTVKNGFHIWLRIDATEVVNGMGTPEFGSGAGSGRKSRLVTTKSAGSTDKFSQEGTWVIMLTNLAEEAVNAGY